MTQRTYTREEMEEIFRRAAEHTTFGASSQNGADAIRYEDLVAAAREVGIEPQALEQVAKKIESERRELIQRSEADQIVQREYAKSRDKAKTSLLRFVIISAFFGALDATTPGGPWAHVLALCYGLFIALRWGRTLLFEPSESDREKILKKEWTRRANEARRTQRLQERAQKERERIEKKQRADAEARRFRDRLEAQQAAVRRELEQRTGRHERQNKAAREFESAVVEGVTALLQAVARRIDAAAKSIENPQSSQSFPSGDFGKYVRAQQGVVEATGPRVRVEPPAPEPAKSVIDGHLVDAQEEADEEAGRRESEKRAKRG